MKRTKEDLIDFRIQKAYQSLEEAKILAGLNHWNTVANRLYYSCFYIVNALFSKYNLITKTHSGTKAEFHKLFIKTGIFDKSFGKLYSELLDKRQEGDYQDFFSLEKEDIEPLVETTQKFIKIIEDYIKSH